ncbi:ORF6N domain-containing protein [Sulfurovum sp.]|uniref:ORF6N domain-containing protein n=1 Tax=Sulfurovum sp. TaxID=1969726 RepID=UPI003566B407
MSDITKYESFKNKLLLLDKDVAELYNVESKKLRQQIKRNIEKFPGDYAYQVSDDELSVMGSQNVTPSKQYYGGHNP